MTVSLILIAVFTGIIAVSNLLLLGGVAFLAMTVKKLVERQVMPAVSEVKSTIANVNKLVDRVEGKAEEIMDIGENTARQVSSRVVQTTDMLQDTVTTPLINISSIIAGITRAVEVWRSAPSMKASGR